ncbi:MAG: hypothetical protein ACREEP_06440 [Dongiaceae bacterium]
MRHAAAAGLAAAEARATEVASVESARARPVSAPSADQVFRYNSFEFVYRQDIGRIVLIGQSPETGERIIQVPSEQVLRAYERAVRAERRSVTPQAGNSSPQPAAQPAPQLAQTLAAAVGGGNNGSGIVSLSA